MKLNLIRLCSKRGLLAGLLLLSGHFSVASEDSITSLPDEVTINGQEMILVKKGWFWREVTAWEHLREEYPPVKNWIDSYYIAKHEARSEDLVRYLNDQLTNNPDFDPNLHESCVVKQNNEGLYTIIRDVANLPANGFSWRQAKKFTEWMGFRLPTEAEWEKAARGPEGGPNEKRLYPWGDREPEHDFVVFAQPLPQHACESMKPVDVYPKGRSPYGLYHMAGNIREFVEDWTDIDNMDYGHWIKDGMKSPPSDGRFTEKTWKMAKGGRFADFPYRLTVGFRTPQEIDNIFRCNGVRFALDVEVVREMLSQGKAKAKAKNDNSIADTTTSVGSEK